MVEEGEPPRVGAVVLAAGGSTRMGSSNKLLEELAGRSLIATVVDVALAAGARPVVVVTGSDEGAVRAALAGQALTFVHNPRWREGMAGSLAAGVAELKGRVAGALVCLGDMPRVTAADLEALIDAFRADPTGAAWVPVFGGRRGNPVLWSATRFADLRGLEGDRGGKALLALVADEVREVEVPGSGVLVDVDTPEALRDVRGETDPSA